MHPEQEPKQRPRIVAVDRDAATRALLADELDARYGRHYDIVIAASSDEARAHLRDVAHGDVALVLADRADDGARLLAATRSLHPHAKRVLLIGWNENRSAREEIVEVLTHGDADYYVAKPTARRPTNGSTARSASSSTTGGGFVVGRSKPSASSATTTRHVHTRSATCCTGTTSPTRSTTSTRTPAERRSKRPRSIRRRPRSSSSTAARRSSIPRTSTSPKRSARGHGPAKAPTTSS